MRSKGALAWAAIILPLLMGGRAASSAASPVTSGGGGGSGGHASARAYALAKRQMLIDRWADPRIRWPLETFAPLLLPGVPLEAALALGVSSTGPTEDLGTAVGLWGVERSNINAWAHDAETQRDFGADGYDPARYATNYPAQVYTGLRRYRDAYRDAGRQLGQLVTPPRESPAGDPSWYSATSIGPWEYQCAVAAYSSGAGALTALVRLHLAALRSVPRATRFSRSATMVAGDCQAQGATGRVAGLPVSGLVGAAWTETRPRERYESARELAAALGRPVDWYTDPGVSPAIDAALSGWTHGGT